jgi:nucleoside-diphosphate-sugar epimerase
LNLLVGGTGFIGGHVVEYLFQQGEISKGVFRKGSHLKILDSNGVQGMEADLLDHHSLHEAIEGVDVVYSMASPMPDSDQEFTKVNTEGLLNLLEVAAESKVKAFVHLSCLDVYGFGSRAVTPSTPISPANEYQRSKAEAERILGEFSKRNSLPRVSVVRSAKVIGSRDETLVVPLLRMAAAGKVILPAGRAMSFAHPRDVAQAMYKAAVGQVPSGGTFLLKSFDATLEDLARGIAAATGLQAEVRKQGFLSSSALPRYAADQVRASTQIDKQESWKDIGYVPQYDLKSTCEEIASWYKKSPWVIESE